MRRDEAAEFDEDVDWIEEHLMRSAEEHLRETERLLAAGETASARSSLELAMWAREREN
jgi:hypothetical protein